MVKTKFYGCIWIDSNWVHPLWAYLRSGRQERGGPCWIVETGVNGNSKSTNDRGPSLFTGLVVPVQEIFVPPLVASWPNTKYFCPHRTLFQCFGPHHSGGQASWADSHAGSPFSYYVSLPKTIYAHPCHQAWGLREWLGLTFQSSPPLPIAPFYHTCSGRLNFPAHPPCGYRRPGEPPRLGVHWGLIIKPAPPLFSSSLHPLMDFSVCRLASRIWACPLSLVPNSSAWEIHPNGPPRASGGWLCCPMKGKTLSGHETLRISASQQKVNK